MPFEIDFFNIVIIIKNIIQERNDSKRANALINIFNREFNKSSKKRRNYIISIRRKRDSKLDVLIFKILIQILKINLIYFNYNENKYIAKKYKKKLTRIDRRAKKIARINEL